MEKIFARKIRRGQMCLVRDYTPIQRILDMLPQKMLRYEQEFRRIIARLEDSGCFSKEEANICRRQFNRSAYR